eukprot:7859609-Pyramimonas_sp.AAC.1
MGPRARRARRGPHGPRRQQPALHLQGRSGGGAPYHLFEDGPAVQCGVRKESVSDRHVAVPRGCPPPAGAALPAEAAGE